MPYETQIEEFDDYLRCTISGTRNPASETADAVAAYAPVFALLREKKLSKLLVIYRLSGRFSPMTGFEHVNNPQSMGWTHDVRIAVVNNSSLPTAELRKIETLAVNRGFPARLFDDETAARDWLLD